jgi:hypothetical protein
VADPAHLITRPDGIFAAPNNGGNPPREVFLQLLASQGLNRLYRPVVAPVCRMGRVRETHVNNISAGVIALPGSTASDFSDQWLYWANWLCDRRDLLGPWGIHVDQVSFALTCEAAGLDVSFLPPQANLVLHLIEQVESIYALHISRAHMASYTEWFGADGKLSVPNVKGDVPVGVRRLNACIERLPAALEEIGLDEATIDF